MAGKPIADSGPEPAGEAPSGAPAPAAPEGPADERFGTLKVRRLSKDDGRALIVYSSSTRGGDE
jgi:hypothetical protein